MPQRPAWDYHEKVDLARLGRGVELFNRGEFFDSHEVLEEAWRGEEGEAKLFLQALIHMAVGMYHWERGNRLGAGRQFEKGLRKLARFPPDYAGIDTRRLHRDASSWREGVLNGGDRPTPVIAAVAGC
jgi:hypothetical protein